MTMTETRLAYTRPLHKPILINIRCSAPRKDGQGLCNRLLFRGEVFLYRSFELMCKCGHRTVFE